MMKKEFTKQQKDQLNQQTKTVLDQLQQGISAREIMAKIYVEGLPNKTLEQGRLMADAILDSVSEFNKNYSEAKNDCDGWLDRTLHELTEDMTCAECCTYLTKLLGTIVAVSNAEHIDEEKKDEILSQIENYSVSEEEATNEQREELFAKLKEAITNSTIMFDSLVSQQDAISQIKSGDEAAELLLGLGENEVDRNAITSMIAYVNIKNGTFADFPEDMDVEQITTLVCAETEQIRITEAVANRTITAEKARALLTILGGIVILSMIPKVIVATVAITHAIATGIAFIPVAFVNLIVMMYLMSKFVKLWEEIAGKVAEKYSVAVQIVKDGIGAILSFVNSFIIEPVKLCITGILTWIIQKMKKSKSLSQEESVAEPDEVITID